MKMYNIPRIDGAPDWSAVSVLAVDTILWEPDCGIRMTQQLCYDDKALYVRQQAWESAIRAEYSTPLSPVHEDSCMEFFFALDADERYFNFEINPNGCIELGFGRTVKTASASATKRNRRPSDPAASARQAAGRRNTACRWTFSGCSIRTSDSSPASASAATATNAVTGRSIPTSSHGTRFIPRPRTSTARNFWGR